MLLHAATETSPFSITVEQAGAKPLTLAAGAITSRYTPTPGILHFSIDPAPMPESPAPTTSTSRCSITASSRRCEAAL